MPEASVTDQLRALFRSSAGHEIRALGVWTRWRWLQALYIEKVERFLASAAGRNPTAAWRRKPPTAEQTYIAREISFALELAMPTFATREAGFEWIEQHAGNPRFWVEPVRPEITRLAKLLT